MSKFSRSPLTNNRAAILMIYPVESLPNGIRSPFHLGEGHSTGATFAMRTGPLGIQMVEEKSHCSNNPLDMKHKERTHSVKGELTLIDTVSLYQPIDMIISNRRHSCVFIES